MNPFHITTLYRKLVAIDHIAWVLAGATMPTITRGEDETIQYFREHKKLWNMETHRRAVRIRKALSDMMEHV